MNSWIDLSAYDMTLLLVVIPPLPGLPDRLLMADGQAERHSEALTRIGFQRDPNSGRWMHVGERQPSFDEIRDAFPLAKFIPDADMRLYARRVGAARPAAPATAAVPPPAPAAPQPVPEPQPAPEPPPPPREPTVAELMAEARPLGLNRQGQKVFQGPERRFVSDARGMPLFEGANASIAPGLFLRATDASQMAVAAEGFVEEAAQGAVLRFDDLRRFASAAYGEEVGADDPRLSEAHEAVQSAMARWLVRKGGRTMAEVFTGAQKLHDAMPYVGDLVRHVPSTRPPLPLPVAVAVQRALGTDTELQGKTVLFTGGGPLFAHLARGAEAKVLASDPAEAANARATLSAAGRDTASLLPAFGAPGGTAPAITRAEMGEADIEVCNLVPGLRDDVAEFEGGLSVSRSDLAEAIVGLQLRKPLGQSIVVLRGGDTPEGREEMERVRAWIARRYAIEGCADIDGSLHSGRADGDAMRVLVVGRQRPAVMESVPDEAMQVKQVASFAELWTWTSQLVYARAQIADYYAALEAAEAALGGEADPDLQLNGFQAPYVSMASSGQASTMVPRNLEGATRDALARVARQHGDVDQWVANELGMTKANLEARFSPEQIDAVALTIDAEERGRGFLNSDQTGIGKGRYLAAVMRRAALLGKKVLFVTERDVNIPDIWRDIRHIGAEEDFSPLILNDGVEVVDEETGDVTMRSQKRDYVLERMEARDWPAEHNLVIATYSQFNKPGVAPEPVRGRGARPAPAPGAEGGAPALPAPAAAAAAVSPKSAWLHAAVDEDTIVVLDECHNAAGGSSNISVNIAAALERAGHVVFSSATWAKNAKNMGIYSRLFPPGFNTSNLGDIVRKGGESMQETLSAMLVKDGVMIRREHDLSKCEFRVENDDEHMERNRSHMDALAPILAEMGYLAGDLDRRVNHQNEALERQLRARLPNDQREVRRRLRSMQVNRMGFGSPLYNLSRLFVCSLLVDMAVAKGVEALRDGRKPVFLVENTIQGVLGDLAEKDEEGARAPDFKDLMHRVLGQLTRVTRVRDGQRVVEDLAAGDDVGAAAEDLVARMAAHLPASVTGADAPDAKRPRNHKSLVVRAMLAASEELLEAPGASPDAVTGAVQRVRQLVDRLPDDAAEAAPLVRDLAVLLPESPARSVRRIKAMIEALPALPASAIDAIRDGVEAEGRRLHAAGEIPAPWTVEEITGRSLEFRNGRVSRRAHVRKADVKNRFNAGITDGVIINTAGATGIDLHAGRRFRNQSRRVMIEVQAPADITRQVQAYGRVNRFDQAVGPQILSLMAGLPMELRLVAMRNAKLRRLSANITSNRDHAALINGIPDLMNAVGDQVCTRYAEARPDLMRRLGFDVERNVRVEEVNLQRDGNGQIEDQRDNDRSANEFLARLAMLSVAQQKQTIEELEAEYRAQIQELDARGENPLKSKTVEGTVHLRERNVFDGADVENPSTEFDRPVFAQTVFVEHAVAPMRGDQVEAEYERGLTDAGQDNGPLDCADRLERNKERMLQTYLPLEISVAQALAEGTYRVLNTMSARTDKLVETLRLIRPGSSVKVTMDGVVEDAVVTRLRVPHPSHMHLASAYDVGIVAPGWGKPQTVSLQSLISDEAFAVGDGLGGDEADKILRSFDRAGEGARLEKRVILTGNQWSAMDLSIRHKLGSMVSWEDDKGVRHRGVLVSKKHADLDFMPIAMRSPAMAAAALATGDLRMFGNSDLNPGGVIVTRTKRDHNLFAVELPHAKSRKYGGIHQHPPIQAMVARLNVADDGQPPKLNVRREDLETVLGHLIDGGVRLYASGQHRAWANEWLAANYAQPEAAPVPVAA